MHYDKERVSFFTSSVSISFASWSKFIFRPLMIGTNPFGIICIWSGVNSFRWSWVRCLSVTCVRSAILTASSDAKSSGLRPATIGPKNKTSDPFQGSSISCFAYFDDLILSKLLLNSNVANHINAQRFQTIALHWQENCQHYESWAIIFDGRAFIPNIGHSGLGFVSQTGAAI